MAQALHFETGFAAQDFREGILRMLVGIAGQCAERFELADCLHPLPDMRTGFGAPGLDREGELRTVEQRRSNHPHEPVLAGIEQLHQAIQPGDTPRGCVP